MVSLHSTTMPSLSYFFEKVALVMCTSLLIFQIYLSWKTFIQEDYVETKSEEKLYNVDLPMIMISEVPRKNSGRSPNQRISKDEI